MKKLISIFFMTAIIAGNSVVFAKDEAPVPLVSVQSLNQLPVESLKKLVINLPSDNLNLHQSEDTESVNIVITVESNYAEGCPQYLPSKDGKTLTIEQKTNVKKMNGRISSVDLSVPAGFSFQEISITGGKNDVSISGIIAQSLTIKGVTGQINLQDLNATTLSIDASLGKFTAEKILSSKKFDLKYSNADLNLTAVDAADLFFDLSLGNNTNLTLDNIHASGNLSVTARKNGRALCTNISASTASFENEKGGTMEVAFKQIPASGLQLKTSGNMNVTFPEKSILWTSGSVDKKAHFKSDFTEDSIGPNLNFEVKGDGNLILTVAK